MRGQANRMPLPSLTVTEVDDGPYSAGDLWDRQCVRERGEKR